jgi:hypothetical protein
MILQSRLPYDIHPAPHLPGVRPLVPKDWLLVDEAYAGQMAERRRLLAGHRDSVLALSPEAVPAAQELLEAALTALPAGFEVTAQTITCPDGCRITRDAADPLGTLGQILQEDFCLMEMRGAEHVLTGAVLCFPASWRLDEKFLRPLTGIHRPVDSYDAGIARRVQRLFDGVQPGRPLWRFNAFPYADPALFQPRSESSPRMRVDLAAAPFVRSERQCILRLPETRAVVFSIHTFMVPRAAVGA